MLKRDFPILNAIFAVPNGFWTENKAYAATMVQAGLTKGISDLICLAPLTDGPYYALLIELKMRSVKSPTNKYIFVIFLLRSDTGPGSAATGGRLLKSLMSI